MGTLGTGLLLMALKWVFIALVYLILVVILLAVRREMSLRLQGGDEPGGTLPGRLRVVAPGSDPRLRPGMLLSLSPITRLGSERDNDIVLTDRFVSGRHAELRWDGVDWWLTDLNSRNGSWVDGARVQPGTPVRVVNGATVRIGESSFEVLE
jgi:hypothetical protein